MAWLRGKLRVGKTVLVTSAGTGTGLAVVKSLAAAGYRVITADFAGPGRGLRSRYSSAHVCLPAAKQQEFENSLLALVDRVRPDAFLPLGDRAVFIASKNRDRIAAVTAVNVPPLEAFLAAYNKGVCMAECRQLGIPCPRVYSPEQAVEMLKDDRESLLVVKPDCDAGAAMGVRYVRNREELSAALGECQTRFGGAVIEEYIPGGVEATKTVVLLFSPQSRLRAAFTTQKIRQWPESGGLTVVARSTAEEHLIKLVLPFFEKWRWCGGAEVELICDGRNGQDKVIEINPRFPGNLRFALECGLGLAVMLANPPPPAQAVPKAIFPNWTTLPSYTTGAKYYNPGLVLRAFLSKLRSGELRGAGFREGLREMLGAAASLPRLLTDPMPLLGRAFARRPFAPGGPPLFQIAVRNSDAPRRDQVEPGCRGALPVSPPRA
jgi:predicted ATP-grasp superfamily ATP-dependent carboligase